MVVDLLGIFVYVLGIKTHILITVVFLKEQIIIFLNQHLIYFLNCF